MSLPTSSSTLQPVQELQVQPVVGTTQVQVRWKRPQEPATEQTASLRGAVPLVAYFYRLDRRRKGTEEWRLVKQGKDFHEVVVEELAPNTIYEFSVMTYTATSPSGPRSQVISCRTNPSAPREPPQNFVVSAVETDSVTVAWQAPDDTTGAILGYRVFYDQGDTTGYIEADLPAPFTTYTARFLEQDTEYRFQVLAYSAMGEGPYTDILVVRTSAGAVRNFLQGRPSQAEITAHVERSTSGSISGRQQVEVGALPESPKLQRRASAASGTKPSIRLLAPARRPSQDDTASPPKAKGESAFKVRAATGRAVQNRQARLEGSAAGDDSRSDTEQDLSESGTAEGQESGTTPERSSGKARPGFSTFQRRRKSKEENTASEGSHLSQDQQRWRNLVPGGGDRRRLEESWAGSVRSRGSGKQRVALDLDTNLVSKGVKIQDDASRSGRGGDKYLASKWKGTIRGKRHGVRTKLEVFNERGKVLENDALSKLYEEERHGVIVLYITSVTAVRETYNRCEDMKRLFYNLRLKVRQKDISLDGATAEELQLRLPGSQPPQVFVNSQYLGDYKKVMELNESGSLSQMLQGFETRPDAGCNVCGGFGYINCTWCQGSKKSIHNPFAAEPSRRALKCTVCNENGLQRCTAC